MHATHMILPKRTINRIDERTYLLMRYLYRFLLPLENSFFRQFFHMADQLHVLLVWVDHP